MLLPKTLIILANKKENSDAKIRESTMNSRLNYIIPSL